MRFKIEAEVDATSGNESDVKSKLESLQSQFSGQGLTIRSFNVSRTDVTPQGQPDQTGANPAPAGTAAASATAGNPKSVSGSPQTPVGPAAVSSGTRTEVKGGTPSR